MTRQPSLEARPNRLMPPLLTAADVERPRLTAAIRATAPSGTCVVSAPPGYGSTTAVAQALAREPHVAWVGLDMLDISPAHFWNQLTAAANQTAEPADISTPTLGGDDDVLTRMAALVEWLDRSKCTWVVLDEVDPETHAAWQPALAYLIANLPRRIRMVITTHHAPQRIPVDPADRRVSLLERDLLLADFDETTAILQGTVPDLDIDTIEEVAAAAQGWVAGIRSAARRALQYPAENAGHWLATKGARALLDPWLDRLPPDRLAFLTDTSLLERLCGELCDHVLGVSGSQSLLESLATDGAYLNALPPSGDGLQWWARHPLLTTALRERPATAADHDRNRRAASWYHARGDAEETMRHILATGRLDEAGAYLRTLEDSLFLEGKADRAAAWYASLPPESWGQLGWHLVRLGWGQVFGPEPQAADVALAHLRAHLAGSPSAEGEMRVLQAETATLAAYMANRIGDTTGSLSYARQALDLFSEANPDNSQQIASVLVIKSLLWEGKCDEARHLINRADSQPFPTPLIREVSLGSLKSQCLVDEGNITTAMREVRRSQRWLTAQGLDPAEIFQFTIMTASGAATLETGDSASALNILQSAAQSALAHGAVGEAAAAAVWQARAHICENELARALDCVQDARRLLQHSAPSGPMLHRVDLTEALIRHMGGDAVRAERLVQRVPPSPFRTLMWARVTMHRQSNAIRRSLASIESDMPRIAIEKQVLLATLALKRSHTLAEGHLSRAADLAANSGFALALLGCHPEILALASAHAQRSSHDALAHLAMVVQRGEGASRRESGPIPNDHSRVGAPLSAGEMQLIAFLPRRDTNAEIAQQLSISINTVKTRLYRLYRKLGVDSRNDAIVAARARGLLP